MFDAEDTTRVRQWSQKTKEWRHRHTNLAGSSHAMAVSCSYYQATGTLALEQRIDLWFIAKRIAFWGNSIFSSHHHGNRETNGGSRSSLVC